MKLLLHTCCGPCFLGVWEELGNHTEISTELYYYNPNIQPDEEYKNRLTNLKKAAASKAVDLLVGEYISDHYTQAIKPFVIPAKAGIQVNGEETGSLAKRAVMTTNERCLTCYRLRLTETARKAKTDNFDAFSTTLLVSPYQQHEKLKEIGEEVAKNYGLIFYYTDWRPFFRGGQTEAKEMELYRQRYCGCMYSKAEASK